MSKLNRRLLMQWREFSGGNSVPGGIWWREFGGGNSVEGIRQREFSRGNLVAMGRTKFQSGTKIGS